jgi:transcriptional regulator with XRE-family HTH domain
MCGFSRKPVRGAITSQVMGALQSPVIIPGMKTKRAIGDHLKEWRQRRHLSQLDLATDLDISARHLSFVETGRSQPSRGMVLKLAERLEVPLRERNALLMAAGFAPLYGARPLSDPALGAARAAVDLVLAGHEPYPALLIDRHWNLVAMNRAVEPFFAGVAPALLAEPRNALRISLHPDGVAPRIENLAQWRAHVLARVARDVEISADPTLAALLTELRDYPGGEEALDEGAYTGIAIPIRIRTPAGLLSFFTTTTVFGTAVEVTLAELVLECFYPADEVTVALLNKMSG